MQPKANKEPFVILIAEDEKTDAFFVQEAVNRMSCKTDLRIVRDGQAVMDFLARLDEYAKAPRPDIILLDINMPRKNGHEVLAEIKANADLRTIPVIMLSGSNAERDILKSYENHANAFVTKANDFSGMVRLMAAIEGFWFRSSALMQQ
ncbi:MAG: response regulator [Alphaproteobacteria bacterium]|nr:response regulator [Alphaproteobacteria bacterium]